MRKKNKNKLKELDTALDLSALAIAGLTQKIYSLEIKLLKLGNDISKAKKLEADMDAFDRSLKKPSENIKKRVYDSGFTKKVCGVCKSSSCDLY